MCEDTVRVAIRIRPLLKTEIEKGCKECLDVVPGEPQIVIHNSDKAFTFNHVFAPDISQKHFYDTAIKQMVQNIFHGYNVTILAYGQTGSGKTHSMGTNYSYKMEDMGVIPRVIYEVFEIISLKEEWSFEVTLSFMELYNEQLYDLLTDKPRSQSIVDIREDVKGIKIVGVTDRVITNATEALQCLAQGSLGRVTGATAMNAHSSRSHAIFTLSVHLQKKDDPNSAMTAKFHLVDLAGSERSKKTQATGERFKEGVNINKGLLALGNVISQLGENGTASYVGYRDSKLTRLLQDSLGGNSMTLMIACISPADYNLDETLSTLRYADRARKIKNKPTVNQDPKISEINRLNKLVQELRLALVHQQIGTSYSNEFQELDEKNKCLQKKVRDLTEKLNENLNEIVIMHERAELAEQAREKILSEIANILKQCKELLEIFNTEPNDVKEHCAKLESLYSNILDIQKTSGELLNYDISLNCKPLVKQVEEAEPMSMDGAIEENPNIIDYLAEKHEEHTLRQTERNQEVQTINRELAIKESLVNQLLKNSNLMTDQKMELQKMELEMKQLQSEEQEHLQALKDIRANNVSSKLAETRRKKVQELEKKIAELSRKCLEQNRVIKANEKQDQQIKKLSSEIQQLKQTRVRLIKQMRVESDKFMKMKASGEKEINRLKYQNRKRVDEMTRLKMQHSLRENVFKRKMEEAFAVNKRLKEVLEKQKRGMQQMGKNKESIQTWVTQELDVLVSTIDAECSLQKLMEERAELTSRLNRMKKSADADEEEISDLTEFLDLRNAQIADLQQKILESDQETRAKTRCQKMHTMSDAKTALEILFESVAEGRKKKCREGFQYNELVEKYESLQAQLTEYQAKEKERRNSGEHKRNKSKNDIQNTDDDIIKSKKEKDENLEKSVALTANSKKVQTKYNKQTMNVTYVTDEQLYPQSDDSIDDDIENDPDWRHTPLYKRIQTLRNTTRNVEGGNRTSVKRVSDGDIKCSCKTKCATRICSCRNHGVICNNCNCNSEICQNREKENVPRTLLLSDDEESTETAKRLKLVE